MNFIVISRSINVVIVGFYKTEEEANQVASTYSILSKDEIIQVMKINDRVELNDLKGLRPSEKGLVDEHGHEYASLQEYIIHVAANNVVKEIRT